MAYRIGEIIFEGGKRWRRKKLKVQGIRSQKEDDTLFIRIQKHQGKILHIYLDLLVKKGKKGYDHANREKSKMVKSKRQNCQRRQFVLL